jgi:hypothetical protein
MVCKYNLNSHKQGKYHLAQRNRNLLYAPTAYTEAIDLNLVWDDFEYCYFYTFS